MAARGAFGVFLVVALAAGCISSKEDSARPRPLVLKCDGGEGNASAFEFAYFGSCWGHVGHHLYAFDPPRLLTEVRGRIFAVEAEVAGIDGPPEISIEASLDGVNWTRFAAVPYPVTGTGLTEERHEIAVDVKGAVTPARFVRVAMPRSTQDGLAGYLDHTELDFGSAQLSSVAPPARSAAAGRCEDGLMDSFFAEHPCWFGGRDAGGGALDGALSGYHVAPRGPGSHYDSPSFFHTYALGAPAKGGVLDATVAGSHWRSPTQLASCRASEPTSDNLAPVVLAEASADGVTWTNAGRGQGAWGERIAIGGEVPALSRFLRFVFAPNPGDDLQASCHHPVGFLTSSEWRVTET